MIEFKKKRYCELNNNFLKYYVYICTLLIINTNTLCQKEQLSFSMRAKVMVL